MILYVNGDSNTAAGEAVNDYCFAEDDPNLWAFGRAPHPDNLKVSWGQRLADQLGATLHCDAESASSNARIIRTTEDYLLHHKTPSYIIIGWSTWEREEWFDKDRYYQVNAGGVAHDWPANIKRRYHDWISGLDYQAHVTKEHRSIYNFHKFLQKHDINHYFFTCFEPFTDVVTELNWDGCYLEPYNRDYTFYNWCLAQGFKPTKPNGYHFGADAHQAWADFLYPKLVQNCLTKK
jgi:hypothetical protein